MPLDFANLTRKKTAVAAEQGNFAPIEPLKRLNRTAKSYETSGFAQFVRELHLDTRDSDIDARREIYEIGQLMAALRSSKLLLPLRDPVHGGFALIRPLPRKTQQMHTVPLAQINSSQLTSIWTASRPRVTVRHFGDTTRAQIQHALLEDVIAHYDAEIFDTYFAQRESLSMMDYGCCVIRPYYDRSLNSLHQIRPVVERKKKQISPSYGFCAECGHEGTAEEFQKMPGMAFCPKCGSSNVPSLIDEQSLEFAEIVAVEEIEQGDISAELLPVPACNWDHRVLAQDSPYFSYKSEVSVRLVRSLLGYDIVGDSPDGDLELQLLRAVGIRGGSVEGYGRDRMTGYADPASGTTILWESWFSPDLYAGVRLSEAEPTVDGGTIPAGTPLDEVFPDGLSVAGFNDYDILVRAENSKQRVVSSIYHIQSHSGVGKGTSDAIEISQQLNVAHSAAMDTIKRFGAGGGIAYDADVLTSAEAKRLLRPDGLVGVKLKGTDYGSVNQAIWKISHQEANASNLAMVAQLTNLINVCFQTTDFTNGVADSRVRINTKGGQELLAAQNQQRSIGPLAMKGWSRARVFEQIIDLFRSHVKVGKFFGSADKFALTKGRFIAGDDIPENVRCSYSPDSEAPIDNFSKRQSAVEMLRESGSFGVPYAQLMQLNPRIAAWWAAKFGVEDIPLFSQHEILTVCQERLDNLKEIVTAESDLAAIAGAYGDPAEAAARAVSQLRRRLWMREENHVLKAQVLAEYLDDDEVADWPPALQAAVELLIEQHYQFDRDARLALLNYEQQGQMALQAEQMRTQAAMQAPIQAAQAEQAAIGRLAEEAAGMVRREEEFDREQVSRDLDHRRELEKAQVTNYGR